MNDVEKVSSSPSSSQPRTPAYASFDSNTDKLFHLFTFRTRGIEGGRKVVDDLKSEFTRMERSSGMVDDVNVTGQRGHSTAATKSLLEQLGAHLSGFIVVVEWIFR